MADTSGAELFNRVYLQDGWSRILPEGAVVILASLGLEGPATRDELQSRLRSSTSDGLGLGSAAWDTLRDWTDEELAELDEKFEGTPFEAGREEPRSATEVMAHEAQARAAHLDEMDSYSAAITAPRVRSLGDLLEFAVKCQIVTLTDGVLRLNASARLPAEVLPLSTERRLREDKLRWADLHEATAQAVIRLFKPDEDVRPSSLNGSLEVFARQLGADPESVRAGMTILVDDGDFAASVDLATVDLLQSFSLSVDWEAFAASRFGVASEPRDGDNPEP